MTRIGRQPSATRMRSRSPSVSNARACRGRSAVELDRRPAARSQRQSTSKKRPRIARWALRRGRGRRGRRPAPTKRSSSSLPRDRRAPASPSSARSVARPAPPRVALEQVGQREPSSSARRTSASFSARSSSPSLEHRRQIEERPRDRGHRNPVDHLDLVGGQLRSVSDRIPSRPRDDPGARHFGDRSASGAEPPELPRRTVAQHRIRPTRQNRRHPSSLGRQAADGRPRRRRGGASAAAPAEATVDRAVARCRASTQLPPRNDPVLPPASSAIARSDSGLVRAWRETAFGAP